MVGLLAVLIGSALGGAARYWLSGLIGRAVGETFPWGTMAVNVSGAGAIGLLAGLAGVVPDGAAPPWWRLVVVGFLGSYTTVSSLSLQTLALARAGEWRRAGANVALSLAFGCGAAGLGILAGVALGRPS